MKPRALKIIYTILTDDLPVAALEAIGSEARELLKERWFLLELSALKVDGEPIYKDGTRLRARPATEAEWTIYEKDVHPRTMRTLLFVYLVDLDRE